MHVGPSGRALAGVAIGTLPVDDAHTRCVLDALVRHTAIAWHTSAFRSVDIAPLLHDDVAVRRRISIFCATRFPAPLTRMTSAKGTYDYGCAAGSSPDTVISWPSNLPAGAPPPLPMAATGCGGWGGYGHDVRSLLHAVPSAGCPPPPQLPPPPPSLPSRPLVADAAPPSDGETVVDATADMLFAGVSATSLHASPLAREWLLGEAWGDGDGDGPDHRRRSAPPISPIGVRAAALFSMHIFDAGGRGLPQDPRVPVPPGEDGIAVEPQDIVTDSSDDEVQFKYTSLVCWPHREWVTWLTGKGRRAQTPGVDLSPIDVGF